MPEEREQYVRCDATIVAISSIAVVNAAIRSCWDGTSPGISGM